MPGLSKSVLSKSRAIYGTGLLVAAFLLALGCGPKPKAVKQPQPDVFPPMQCVGMVNNAEELMLACAETKKSCLLIRRAALKFGNDLGIVAVGECFLKKS